MIIDCNSVLYCLHGAFSLVSLVSDFLELLGINDAQKMSDRKGQSQKPKTGSVTVHVTQSSPVRHTETQI